jgi:hypothetical protein
MSLQRSTIEVCDALLRLPEQMAPLVVLRFPAQMSPLSPCGSGVTQSIIKDRSQSMMPSPLNQARHTTYSIPK